MKSYYSTVFVDKIRQILSTTASGRSRGWLLHLILNVDSRQGDDNGIVLGRMPSESRNVGRKEA